LNFILPLLTFDYHQYHTRRMSVAEIVGVFVGRLFQTTVELKIYYLLYAIHKLLLLIPALSCHFGPLVNVRLVIFSLSSIILKKRKKKKRVRLLLAATKSLQKQWRGLGVLSSLKRVKNVIYIYILVNIYIYIYIYMYIFIHYNKFIIEPTI